METNMEPLPGYGVDHYCENAGRKIQEACGCPEAQVYFLTGGTQTNAVIISSILKSYEGVIAAETGHVNTHEAGAIEYTGHKVLALPEHQGKLDAGEIRTYLKNFYEDESYEHEVFREWFICPGRQSTVRCTAGRNWRISLSYVMNTRYRSFWTGPVLAMD